MSRGATARLFVAVDPPASACDRLLEWGRAVTAAARAAGGSRGSLRLLEAQSLHLTLCFLGNRPVDEIETLARALAPCIEGTCELTVGAPLWLPPRRPHALAVEIHDHDGQLQCVHERVSEALCEASAWRPERRRFRAHVTLARVRGGSLGARRAREVSIGGAVERPRPRRVSLEQALPATPQLSFTAERIVLYRSWLASDGASYEALASSELVMAAR
jgi:2'-5' RNA ligase